MTEYERPSFPEYDVDELNEGGPVMGTRIITRRPSRPVRVAREAGMAAFYFGVGIFLGCVLFLSSLGTLWLIGVLA